MMTAEQWLRENGFRVVLSTYRDGWVAEASKDGRLQHAFAVKASTALCGVATAFGWQERPEA